MTTLLTRRPRSTFFLLDRCTASLVIYDQQGTSSAGLHRVPPTVSVRNQGSHSSVGAFLLKKWSAPAASDRARYAGYIVSTMTEMSIQRDLIRRVASRPSMTGISISIN